MKCFAPLVVLAAGASAMLVTRDLATVIDIMTPILDGLHTYHNVLDSYSANLDGKPLEQFGATMLNKIANATNLASQMAPLNMTEAYGFKNMSEELNVAGDTVIYQLGNMTARFEAGKECGYIVPHCTTLAARVDSLMKTVAGMFPSAGQNRTAGIIDEFDAHFAAANAALATCKDMSAASPACKARRVVREA